MLSKSRPAGTRRLSPVTALLLLPALLFLRGHAEAEERVVGFLTSRGDLNLDGKVDVKDVFLLSRVLFQDSRVPVFAPIADMDEDGTVGPADLRLIASSAQGMLATHGVFVVTGGSEVDVNALVQSVLRMAYLDVEEDLQFYAEKLKNLNDLKKKTGKSIQLLRDSADARRPVDQRGNAMDVLLLVSPESIEDKSGDKSLLRKLGLLGAAETIGVRLRGLDTDETRVTIAVIDLHGDKTR